MRILQICNKAPFPPKDGGCIAMNSLTQGLLSQGHTVKVLAMNTAKHFVKPETLPTDYKAKTRAEFVFIDTAVKPLPAFLNLFSNTSYNISRFYSKAFEGKIAEILSAETFDIIQLESLYVSMYADVIRRYSNAKIVLRAHNVEHLLWERNAASAGNPLKKSYFNLLVKRLKAYETKALSAFDAIAAITEDDAAWFRKHTHIPVMVIPFGINLQTTDTAETVEEEPLSVFHIGAMDWQPNVEGLQWFLENVWHKVHLQHPQLKLYLAGKSMSEAFKKQIFPNVTMLGEVENAQQFMRSKGLMLAPLLSGGGMRVKIIEGMALGKVILSTPVGAEGIDCENGKDILIAADANAFAEAVSRYVNDPQRCRNIGEAAKRLAAEKYNNSDICTRLTAFYNRLIQA